MGAQAPTGRGDFFNPPFTPTIDTNIYPTEQFEGWWADGATPNITPLSNEGSDDVCNVSRTSSFGPPSSSSETEFRQRTTPTSPTIAQPYKELRFMPQDGRSNGSQVRSENGELQRKQACLRQMIPPCQFMLTTSAEAARAEPASAAKLQAEKGAAAAGAIAATGRDARKVRPVRRAVNQLVHGAGGYQSTLARMVRGVDTAGFL